MLFDPMKTFAVALLCLLSPVGFTAAKADEPRVVKVVAKAELPNGWLDLRGARELLVDPEVSHRTTAAFRSSEELAKPFGFNPHKEDLTTTRKWRLLHDSIATSLGVKELNFEKHMLLAACAGKKGGGGDWRLEFKDAVIKDKKMIVTLVLHPTKTPDAKAVNWPAVLVLVEKFEGEVVFNTVEPKGEK